MAKLTKHWLRAGISCGERRAELHVKIVSEMLGHSSVSFTLDRYSHVIPTIQREAARVMTSLALRRSRWRSDDMKGH
jgi:integrase